MSGIATRQSSTPFLPVLHRYIWTVLNPYIMTVVHTVSCPLPGVLSSTKCFDSPVPSVLSCIQCPVLHPVFCHPPSVPSCIKCFALQPVSWVSCTQWSVLHSVYSPLPSDLSLLHPVFSLPCSQCSVCPLPSGLYST